MIRSKNGIQDISETKQTYEVKKKFKLRYRKKLKDLEEKKSTEIIGDLDLQWKQNVGNFRTQLILKTLLPLLCNLGQTVRHFFMPYDCRWTKGNIIKSFIKLLLYHQLLFMPENKEEGGNSKDTNANN